jgi:hypothetical protein
VGRRDILGRSHHGAEDRTSSKRHPALSSAPVLASATVAALAVSYLLAPTMGVDLSAQLLRANFAGNHPLTPVDLRWFGGTYQFGYSLWVPALMAVLGAKLVGALAAVVSTLVFTRLLQSVDARRPLAGGIAAAVCQAANLVEGRIAFAVGMACGLGALLALANKRRLPMIALALLAGAANPVVALLLWICAAVAIARRRFTEGTLLLVGSAIPVAVISGVFSDSGNEPFGRSDALHALLASLIVLATIPLRHKAIRLGAAIGTLMVILAYFVHTPVGSNSTRLTLLFAIPLVVALVEFRWLITVLVTAVAVLVQVPFTFGTLTAAGSPATKASYYQPLLDELHTRGPLQGRIEIPEVIGHWDSFYVARRVPLARGWLRQLDTSLNGPALYDRAPTPSTYRTFLDRNAVAYVAVPDARLSAFGRREVNALAAMPYLHEVWRDQHWRLYAVDDPTDIVSAPGELISYTADDISVDASAGDRVVVNVRWSDWLSVSGPPGCIARSGNQIVLRAQSTGRFTLTSTLTGDRRHC